MRIVIIGPTHPFRGGIAQYTAALAQSLGGRHQVTLLTFTRQYPRWLFPGRTDRDPSVWVRPQAAERVLDPLLPWTWWRTARRVVAVRPDLLLVQWWVPYFAPSLMALLALVRRAWPVRVVVECHNVLPHDGRGWLARALTRGALASADAFIVHAETDRAALDALGVRPAAPRLVVAMPPATVPPAMGRAAARVRLGLPPAAPVALFFGFVRPYKGLDLLLEALPTAVERVPDLRLLVAGEFWEPVARYQARARALGVAEAVRFDDRYIPNEEVGAWFGAADVVVLPYVEASQSAVVPLAVAFGLPVVATCVGGLPDVVRDGESGLLVPPGDAPALGAALARLFTEPGLLDRLRHGTREDRDRFSWADVVATVEAAADTAPAGCPVPAA